jgi:hypothetical protein
MHDLVNWQSCFRTEPDAVVTNVRSDVERFAIPCRRATGMNQSSEAKVVEVSSNTSVQAMSFSGDAHACYRLYVAAEPTLSSYNVFVLDSNGGVITTSMGDEHHRALPDDGPICFETNDDAEVIVAPRKGHGTIAVQLWAVAR